MSLERSFQMSGSFHYQNTIHRYSQLQAEQVIFRKNYYNIFMVGNSGTGKTSIIRRLTGKNVDKFHHQTMNQEIIRIDFEKQDLLLYLFDNPGRRDQQYCEESIQNLECANVIVMVYDNQFVDNLKDSLIDDWIPDIQAIMQKYNMDPKKLDIILCCNKSDIKLKQSYKQKKQKLSEMFEDQVSKIGLSSGIFEFSCLNQAQQQFIKFIKFKEFLFKKAFEKKISDYQQNKKLRQSFVSQNSSRPNSQIYIRQQQQIRQGPQTIKRDSNLDIKQSLVINNKNQQIKENQINQNNLSGREKQVNIQNQNQKQKQKKKRKTNKQSNVNQNDQEKKKKEKEKEKEKQQKQKEDEIERKNNQGKKQNEAIMQEIQPNNNQPIKDERKLLQKQNGCSCQLI